MGFKIIIAPLFKEGLYWICPVLRHSVVLSFPNVSDENILGTLWAQLLLQFSTDCFDTLQMFSAWNENVHVGLV